jgi:hypothetical protein
MDPPFAAEDDHASAVDTDEHESVIGLPLPALSIGGERLGTGRASLVLEDLASNS